MTSSSEIQRDAPAGSGSAYPRLRKAVDQAVCDALVSCGDGHYVTSFDAEADADFVIRTVTAHVMQALGCGEYIDNSTPYVIMPRNPLSEVPAMTARVDAAFSHEARDAERSDLYAIYRWAQHLHRLAYREAS